MDGLIAICVFFGAVLNVFAILNCCAQLRRIADSLERQEPKELIMDPSGQKYDEFDTEDLLADDWEIAESEATHD